MSDTHWKRLINPDYLGAYSLDPGKDMILTIKQVRREVITGTGGKQEECTVCHWQENEKLRLIAKSIPEKYGNNNQLADAVTKDFSSTSVTLVQPDKITTASNIIEINFNCL